MKQQECLLADELMITDYCKNDHVCRNISRYVVGAVDIERWKIAKGTRIIIISCTEVSLISNEFTSSFFCVRIINNMKILQNE